VKSIAAFYLARRAEGFSKFELFAASYRRHPAGTEHDFNIIAKGFDDSELIELSRIFDGIPYQIIRMDDEIGFDLHAYLLVAGMIENPIVCFLNTHTRLRADNWLLKLYNGFQAGGVGLAGASGSYQSLANRRIQKLRSLRCVMAATRALRLAHPQTDGFPHFPNPHIRTNVFLLSRTVFLAMPVPGRTKRSCFLFESGPDGLTAAIKRQGLKAVVVGANGRVYGELDWPKSRGFRLRNQSNLLAEDNATDLFRDAARGHQRFLSKRAWGIRRWF
jgi:hypothetical protein